MEMRWTDGWIHFPKNPYLDTTTEKETISCARRRQGECLSMVENLRPVLLHHPPPPPSQQTEEQQRLELETKLRWLKWTLGSVMTGEKLELERERQVLSGDKSKFSLSPTQQHKIRIFTPQEEIFFIWKKDWLTFFETKFRFVIKKSTLEQHFFFFLRTRAAFLPSAALSFHSPNVVVVHSTFYKMEERKKESTKEEKTSTI